MLFPLDLFILDFVCESFSVTKKKPKSDLYYFRIVAFFFGFFDACE